MFYKLIMGDNNANRLIERIIEASNVFDAISIAEAELEHPEDTELIEAFPLDV